MDRTQIVKVLESVAGDIEAIEDEKIKAIQKTLLNLIELLLTENERLQKENQQLRDEINRLKGEQGKPNIRKQTLANTNISSEQERNKRKKAQQNKKRKNKKPKKKNAISVDRVETCDVNKEELPDDAEFKGYKEVVVQDIIIKTDNIKFKKAVYYSASLKKTFMASLPPGYRGEFGPGLKSEIISLCHKSKMTESAIAEYFRDHGIRIGAATISRFLTDGHGAFHQEKEDIVRAGLSSTIYQQMDDTSARVNGKNRYVHVLCNKFYTAYFTREHKNRLTILEILNQGELEFKFDDTALAIMQKMHLPEKTLNLLKKLWIEPDQNKNRHEVDELLKTFFPEPKKHLTNRQIILESTAIAAYQASPHSVKLLLTDDAPQYNQITPLHALCWVHDGRHYKKLNPVIVKHRKILDEFIGKYWDYYQELLAYKAAPTPEKEEVLSRDFDVLFSTRTDYQALNERIEKTKNHKEQLLLCMKYIELPAHNNDSELGARDQSRRRDISFHTINEKGTKAKDTFMTLAQTARKLLVNFSEYIRDRVFERNEKMSLADLVLRLDQNLVLTLPRLE